MKRGLVRSIVQKTVSVDDASQWHLLLECGHMVTIKARRRPKRQAARCHACINSENPTTFESS